MPPGWGRGGPVLTGAVRAVVSDAAGAVEPPTDGDSSGGAAACGGCAAAYNGWNFALAACVLLLLSATVTVTAPLLLGSVSHAADPLLSTKRKLAFASVFSIAASGILFCVLPSLPENSAVCGALLYHAPQYTMWYFFACWILNLYFVNRRHSLGMSEGAVLIHALAPGGLFAILASLVALDYAVLAAGSSDGFISVQVLLASALFLVVAVALRRALRADEMAYTPSALTVLRRLRLSLPVLALSSAAMLALKVSCYLAKGPCAALHVPCGAAYHPGSNHDRGPRSELNAASFCYALGVVLAPGAAMAWTFSAPAPYLGLYNSPRRRDRGSRAGDAVGDTVTDPGCCYSFGVVLFALGWFLLRSSGDPRRDSGADGLALPSPDSLGGFAGTAYGPVMPAIARACAAGQHGQPSPGLANARPQPPGLRRLDATHCSVLTDGNPTATSSQVAPVGIGDSTLYLKHQSRSAPAASCSGQVTTASASGAAQERGWPRMWSPVDAQRTQGHCLSLTSDTTPTAARHCSTVYTYAGSAVGGLCPDLGASQEQIVRDHAVTPGSTPWSGPTPPPAVEKELECDGGQRSDAALAGAPATRPPSDADLEVLCLQDSPQDESRPRAAAGAGHAAAPLITPRLTASFGGVSSATSPVAGSRRVHTGQVFAATAPLGTLPLRESADDELVDCHSNDGGSSAAP
eukprot:TRINITY_DN55225_c0_g1_i1.p1 TRINITY_DN55225_c0_g1~~TRINITY_DN55225_c0_g1_i1.p1  ORF type:complete len:691 (+),score=96.33 TRINITY_DN55225_c0_g1_i1:144-2216(+)